MNKGDKRQEVYLQSLNNYTPYRGDVLIKLKSKEGATTKAGIIVGFEPETKYVEETGSHIADLTATEGEVIALPIHHWTEGYTIENELRVGDYAYFNYFASIHGTDVWVGSPGHQELYRLIPYSGMMAAKRGDEVIILNGFVLLEEVNKKDGSDVLWSPSGKDNTRGIVRYMGGKRKYDSPNLTDDIDIEIGDIVLIRKGAPVVPFERQSYLATFDDGKLYRRVKRMDIAAVINSFTQYQI